MELSIHHYPSMKLFLCPFFILIFTLHIAAQPIINSFLPTSGAVGTAVTITGANFTPSLSGNIVYIGGIRANVTAASTTSITVTVPAGGMAVPVTVTTNNLTAYSRLPFTITFTGAAPVFTPGSFSYAGRIDSVASGIETTMYTFGDIDGDGKLDGITVDRLNNSLSIYRNTTAGGVLSFAENVSTPTSTSPRSVSCGDVDGDGKQDILVSNLTANTVSIFRNTSTLGMVSFAPKIDFATAIQPSKIVLEDVDKDGRPDLVVNTINTNGFISVLRNTTAGTSVSFDPKIDLTAIGGSIEELAMADLDGDNKPDIIVPNFGLNSISIFRNTSSSGTVAFASKLDIATGRNPAGVSVGDLNDDGKPDLVVSCSLSNYIYLFRNTGSAGTVSFAAANTVDIGSMVDATAISDLDGDGKQDIVVTGNTDSVTIFKNNTAAGGTFSLAAAKRFSCSGQGPLYTGDFDGDGMQDISFRFGVLRAIILKNTTTLPYIYSFAPAAAGTGTTVTINGVNFNQTASITFGGIPAASFTVLDAATIRAVVATGATGEVVVATPLGKASKTGFIYFPAPVITSFSPVSGSSATIVTITGRNFTGATAVSFGGIAAGSFTVVSATTIQATVAAGATGVVTVTTPGGTASLGGFVFVPPPVISSFTPATGGPGTLVTIQGSNFLNVSAVSFGGVPAASFTVNSSTQITAVVGAGASGNVLLTSSYGSTSMPGFVFVPAVPPVINAFSPASGPAGTAVTISGAGFGSVGAHNVVYFGATRASVVSATSTQLIVNVPAGATFEPISVYNTDTYVTGYSANPFIVTFADGEPFLSPLSFSQKTEFSVGLIVGALTLKDVDGDGKADVVYCDNGTGVHVLKNTTTGGLPSFAPSIRVANTLNAFYGVITPDIDGDGLPDIAATNLVNVATRTSYITVLRNASSAGSIKFDPLLTYTTQNWTADMAAGDLNRDGKPDIVVSNKFSNTISIFTNTSTPGVISFAQRVDLPAGQLPGGVVVADLDGDQWPDVAVNNPGSGSVTILRNLTGGTGSLSFAPAQQIQLTDGGRGYIIAGDLNGDNKPDLVLTNGFNSKRIISILRNTSTTGTISFAGAVEYPTVIDVSLPVINDLNGDGRPDIAVTGGYGESVFSLYSNTSVAATVSFAPQVTYRSPGYSLFGIAAGDMDGDDKPDLLISDEQSKIIFFKNQADLFVPKSVCNNAGVTLTSNLSSTSYQWQVNTGNGFVNLVNNGNYNNVNAQSLQISGIPVSFNNYQYRCLAAGTPGKTFVLTVTAPPATPTISNLGNTKFCEGDSVILTANSASCSTCTYNWSNSASGESITVRTGGDYTVTVTNVCGAATAGKPVTVQPKPVISIAATADGICSGSSTQLTASGAGDYLWTPSTGLNPAYGAVVKASPVVTSTYTVTGIANGCAGSKSIVITVSPLIVPAISITNTGCGAADVAFTAVLANGGATPTVEWFANNVLAGQGNTFSIANPAIGTQVYAKLTSSATCLSAGSVNSTITTLNCAVTSVPDIDGLEDFQIAPNPTKGMLTLTLKLRQSKNVSFRLTDNTGKVVYNTMPVLFTGTTVKQIDLYKLPQGLYYLKTSIGNKATTNKIILAR